MEDLPVTNRVAERALGLQETHFANLSNGINLF